MQIYLEGGWVTAERWGTRSMDNGTEGKVIRMIRSGIRPGVLLDMDNTTTDFAGAMVPLLNRKLGSHHSAEEMNSEWRWMQDVLHLPEEVFWEIYNDAWAHHRDMRILVEPAELEAVSKHYRVDFGTARESHVTMPYVFNLIDDRFPRYRGIIMDIDLGVSKTVLGHPLLVDDAPHVAGQVEKEEGRLQLLVRGNGDSPYGYSSRIPETEKVRHVTDTHEAMRWLLDLARKADGSERVTVTKAKEIG